MYFMMSYCALICSQFGIKKICLCFEYELDVFEGFILSDTKKASVILLQLNKEGIVIDVALFILGA